MKLDRIAQTIFFCDCFSLREKCPNTELFWSVFSCIRTEDGSEITAYLDAFHVVIFNPFLGIAPILYPLKNRKSLVFVGIYHGNIQKQPPEVFYKKRCS